MRIEKAMDQVLRYGCFTTSLGEFVGEQLNREL